MNNKERKREGGKETFREKKEKKTIVKTHFYEMYMGQVDKDGG